jgi:hypothetical protein
VVIFSILSLRVVAAALLPFLAAHFGCGFSLSLPADRMQEEEEDED